jgi:hypothetical protein
VSDLASQPAAGPAPDTAPHRPSWLVRVRADLLVGAGYVAVGWYLLSQLWLHVDSRILVHSYSDQYQFEWFIGADTRAVLGLHDPLVTQLQNVPVGVNMLGNASILGLAVPLTPVTVLFGPTVSFALTITLGLAGTAFGWYWVLHRDLGLHRIGAVIGGAFAAFAPPVVSHANAHPNLVAMLLIPWIVRFALRMADSTRPVRDGVWLGLLVAYQVFVGEETLLMTALALALIVPCYAVSRRRELRALARPFLTGTGIAVLVAGALLAYPLYVQFAGPGRYQGLGSLALLTNDLSNLTAYSTYSLGYQGGPLGSGNYAEENAYFGWPLLLLALVVAVWLWRDRLVRVCAIVAVVFLACSLGGTVRVEGVDTGVPGPWRLLRSLPLLDSMNVARFTFVTVAAVGVMLAVATDRVIAVPSGTRGVRPVRAVWIAALAGALVPLVPMPLPAMTRQPVPDFFTAGTYRAYVARDRAIVPIPAVNANDARALRWQAVTGMSFGYPEGYFIGPNPRDGEARYSPPPSATTSLIRQVHRSGTPVVLTGARRAAVLADLRRWRADAVVAYREPQISQLRATLDPVLGPAHPVDDVWLWDVRALTRS